MDTTQELELVRLRARGRALAEAKRATAQANAEAKAAMYAALDLAVPITRISEALGLPRSVLYRWLDEQEEASE